MIGIFDSGIGGLTVASEIQYHMPEHDIVYLGDTLRAPYGDASVNEIRQYAKQQASWLKERGAHVIVTACHTLSTLAYDDISSAAGVPVLGMVNPVIISALKHSRKGNIGIIATQGTINSGVYQKRITAYAANRNQNVEVHPLATPELVPLIEGNTLVETLEETLERILAPLIKRKIDTLILGCTHYPLIRQHIERVVGHKVVVIDPSVEMTKQLIDYLAKHESFSENLSTTQKRQYYFTDVSDHLKSALAFMFDERINPQKTVLP
ncbi:MAG: glutamate racemase [Patescibacteria group bacterium]